MVRFSCVAHMRILKAAPKEAFKECVEPLQHLWNPGAQPAVIWPYVFWCEYWYISHVYGHASSCARTPLIFLFSPSPNVCLM